MHNLLNAGFSRLKKNKIFLGLIIITLICAAFFLFGRYYDGIKYNGYGFSLKSTGQLLLEFTNIIGFFIALFTSLFVGTEYSDGTIRNKIIIGHSRKNIYLSNLIISITVGIIIELIYLLIVAAIGIPMFGELQIPLSEFLFILLDILMIIVSFSSIFNFISLICSNITIS